GGPDKPGAIALNLVKGAFRFATGNAAKQAYSITTPTAALGVRGTTLNIASTSAKTVVDLVERAVVVCTRRASQTQCTELTYPGQEAVVTVTQIAVSQTGSSGSGAAGGFGFGPAAPSPGQAPAPAPSPGSPGPGGGPGSARGGTS